MGANQGSGIGSYPKVYNMGHPAITDLFDGDVVVQEKVDGSQFSFAVVGGELRMRSKGAVIYDGNVPNLFAPAAETATALFRDGALREGWSYRAEALFRPRHNVLTYGRAPNEGMVLFDVDEGLEDRVSEPDRLRAIGDDLGLEVVPTLHVGEVPSIEFLKSLIAQSFLGEVEMEGVVVKNYARFNPKDGKMLMGKVVTEAFREVHKSVPYGKKPKKDALAELTGRFRTEARWQKAVQRMAEAGSITHSPKDIGHLIKSVQQDIRDECEADIKEALYQWYIKDITRGATGGLPEWYKARLLERQFGEAA